MTNVTLNRNTLDGTLNNEELLKFIKFDDRDCDSEIDNAVYALAVHLMQTKYNYDRLQGFHKDFMSGYEIQRLKKRFRVVTNGYYLDMDNKEDTIIFKQSEYHSSVVCFVDFNGDVLKGNWKAPVKNPKRGSLFNDNPYSAFGSGYNLLYLR